MIHCWPPAESLYPFAAQYVFSDPNGIQSDCWHRNAEVGWESTLGENASLVGIQPFCLKLIKRVVQRLFIWPNRQTPDTGRLQCSLVTVHHSDAQVMCDRDMTC